MPYDPRELETPGCPMCGSDDRLPTPFGRDGLGVVRCTACRVLFLSPRLTEQRMVEYYRDGSYFEGSDCGYTSYVGQEKTLRLTFRRLLESLERKGLTGGSVLEVGCGHGFFLDEARTLFSRRVGTDLSEAAVTLASARADEVWAGGIQAVPGEERFDLIVALHVIEHVYEPRSFTRDLVSRVRPGGHLLLATPNAGSFWFHLLGKRWPSFKFPEHLVFHDRRSLTDLLRNAGLSHVRKIGYPHAFPVSEILRKVGISHEGPAAEWSAWLPATTLALVGRARL